MVILARALYDFEGAQSDDLSFKEGEIIEVLEKDESGWWIGRIDNRKGEFPFNFVELMSEAEVKAYLSNAEAASSSAETAVEAPMAVAGDSVSKMKILSVESGKNGMEYVIESSTTQGKVETSHKTVASFRALDAQLRTLLPDFEGNLPPKWADRAILSDHSAKKQMHALEEYVDKLAACEGADFLLVPWLFQGQGIQLSADALQRAKAAQEKAKADAAAKPPESPPVLARVLYDWEPQDRVELPMREGDVIAVLNQNTGSRGWWEGQAVTGARGLFPSNHIELMDAKDAIAWMNGDASKAISTTYASGEAAAAATETTKKEKKKKDPKDKSQRPPKIIPGFSLGSTQAFDELLEKGYCIEGPGGTPYTPPTTPCPGPGDLVKLSFAQCVWDSQALSIVEVLASTDPDEGPMEFVVDGKGDDEDPSVVKGIMECVKKMSKGTICRLVCTPAMAYGVVGAPPLIPPLSHIVYDLKLEEFGNQKPRRASLLMRLIKPPKPEVEARERVTSIRMMQPIANRGDGKSGFGVVAAASSTGGGATTKAPTRQAGHVLIDRAPATQQTEVSRAKQAEPKKKFEYQVLKKMAADNVDFNSMGMDRQCLEDYLNDAGFVEAFQMDKTQFLLKPKWRQVAAKRQAGLF